ncbi:hypothetical protein LC593_03660 [Nostoc sp. CHAB 5844]|nr:hypothetical protein [Nostoc sp. CHAB 5844]
MWNSKTIISSIASCGLILSLAGGVAMFNDKPLRVYAQIPNPKESQTTQFRRIEQPLSMKGAVTAVGLALIGLEIWWFLLSKPKSQSDQVHRKSTK